ncbi:MAG: hypothetical protein J7J20_05880 [Desulfurococcales archaeon]|nr:hypothetical protein [Desulfurococcales archaeon]
MSGEERKNEVRVALRIFFQEVLSKIVPGLHVMLEFHVRNELGKGLISSIIEEPSKVFNALVKVTSGEGLRALDYALTRYITRVYRVKTDGYLLTELGRGNNKPLIDVAQKLYRDRYLKQ